jgi:hypothetical protein
MPARRFPPPWSVEEYNGDCGERCEFRLLRKSATQSGASARRGECADTVALTSQQLFIVMQNGEP